jgi:hypothetical protein
MHSVDKGELGRQIAIYRLLKLGYVVSCPISENCDYDLIAEEPEAGNLLRVQVKARHTRSGILSIPFQSSNERFRRRYTSKTVDWILGVDLESEQVYRFTKEQFDNQKSIMIRSVPTKYPGNATGTNIRWADDFRF